MDTTKIICNRNFNIGEIDPRLYGSFLEHMGRVIYTGIYEPDHKSADEDGFRKDVLEKVRQMGVTCVRYPGGNFVSAYHWEDGIGPKQNRPRRLDLAWRSIESNAFGTDEMIRWSVKAGVDPIFTVNLGTRGITEALQYLEYCNFKKDTYFSDLRRQHGRETPYGIKFWCLGNEMDGEWQIGHKSALEYGRLAAETGRAMKYLDPSIELIACGSSLSTMTSCPEWDLTVLEHTYDVIDYLALHQYYGGQEKGTKGFLAQSLDMEEHIRTIQSAAQVIKRKRCSKKNMKFSVDEWGVWTVPGNTINEEIERKIWQHAPAISEQIYTLEDALLFASMQMTILRHADIIKIACQSLLTNVSACIMTKPNGELWLQTNFFPFYYLANYARGIVLNPSIEGPVYSCQDFEEVACVDVLAVHNPKEMEIAVFLVNRDEENCQNIRITLEGFDIKEIKDAVVLTAEDKKQTNEQDHLSVVPKKNHQISLIETGCEAILEKLSFHMIRIGI